MSASLYSDSEIGFERVFSVAFLDEYVRGNQFREVVHDESGKKLLDNVLHLFCVEMEQANSVLQRTERSLDAPAHSVKALQLLGRKFVGIEIGNDGFVRIVRSPKFDNTEREIVKSKRIALTSVGRQEVEGGVGIKELITGSIL